MGCLPIRAALVERQKNDISQRKRLVKMSQTNDLLAKEQNGRFAEKCDAKKRIVSLVSAVMGLGLVAAALAGAFSNNDTLFYTAIVIGLVLALYGVAKMAFGCSVLTDTKSGAKVETRNIYFPSSEKAAILNAISNGDWKEINKGSQTTSTLPLCLRAWFTEDGSYASTMLLEYVPYEYVPVTRLQEVQDDVRNSFILKIKEKH